MRPLLVVHPKIRLGHHGAEKGRMATKTIGVNIRLGVNIHAAYEQPARDFQLIVVDAHVQQGRSRQGGSLCGLDLVMAAKLRWINLLVLEGSRQEFRIPAEMLL